MSSSHLFFCVEPTCNKVVPYNGAPCCLDHNPMIVRLDESMSYETNDDPDCPRCEMDICMGADGYCGYCWNEQFGSDDINTLNAVYPYLCIKCDEIFHSTQPKGRHDRYCYECEHAAAATIKTWWKNVQYAEFSRRHNCECRHSPPCKTCLVYYGYDDLTRCRYTCTQCGDGFVDTYARNPHQCPECELAHRQYLGTLPASPVASLTN